MRRPLLLMAWLALVPLAHAVPVSAVPDERLRAATVVDLTGTLTPADKDAITAAAQRGKAGGELYVAVVDTTDGRHARAYATELFNRLGLDHRQRNRGALLMAALNDRAAEIVIGDGYPNQVTRVTDQIMADVVVARFKAGSPREALVEGARALVDRVLLGELPVPVPVVQVSMQRRLEIWDQPKGWSGRVSDLAGENPFTFWGGLSALGLGALIGTRRFLRWRPRTCERCGQHMERLDEVQDDAHLSSGEQKEESLRSVDYDVWMCRGCTHVLKLRYGTFFTRYSRCYACRSKTKSSSSTTLRYATTISTGLIQIEERCEHCGDLRSYTRTTARLSDSDSDSSGGGGGSSSGRGSSGTW